jgi:hypothetical protein
MRTLARAAGAAALTLLVVSGANAATISLPLENPGDGLTSTRTISLSNSSFSDEYVLTTGVLDLGVGASLSGAPTPGCAGICGINNLLFSLFDSGHNPLMPNLTTLTTTLLAGMTYYLDVTGETFANGGTYTLSVNASAADPVGAAPIPGAALLLLSGFAALYGASRKKISGSTMSNTEPTQA